MTPQRKISCHMFKMPIFPKFFGDIMSHIIRSHADEKIKYFVELFISKNFEYTFSLSLVIGLYKGQLISELNLWNHCFSQNTRLSRFLPSLNRADILTIFRLHLGRNDDFTNSFWNCLTLKSDVFGQNKSYSNFRLITILDW